MIGNGWKEAEVALATSNPLGRSSNEEHGRHLLQGEAGSIIQSTPRGNEGQVA